MVVGNLAGELRDTATRSPGVVSVEPDAALSLPSVNISVPLGGASELQFDIAVTSHQWMPSWKRRVTARGLPQQGRSAPALCIHQRNVSGL